jgi:hypothetical protein
VSGADNPLAGRLTNFEMPRRDESFLIKMLRHLDTSLLCKVAAGLKRAAKTEKGGFMKMTKFEAEQDAVRDLIMSRKIDVNKLTRRERVLHKDLLKTYGYLAAK